MKNLVLILAIAAFVLTSCSKDESFDPAPQTSDHVYVVDFEKPGTPFTTLASENRPSASRDPNGLFAETSGARTTGPYLPGSGYDPVTLTWAGLQDETGIYGTAELNVARSNYTMHIIMEAECIAVHGNKVTYGGVITQVIQLSGDTPPVEPGWKFYFQAKDLEHGLEAGNDRVSNTYIFAPPFFESLCSVYTPGHSIWSQDGYQEVSDPGYVFVSGHPE